MCGIVGLISKRQGGFQVSDQDMFRRLLILDGEFRGLDATGLFQVQKNRQAFTVKAASIPSLFMSTPQWTEAMSRMYSSSRVIIGHNRKATMGSTSSKNAHPFHEDNIILVHNGTLHNHTKLAKDVDVDSHAVCKAFAAGKANEVLPTIDGAFAFVWWDMQKDRLFAIRNKERPLSFIETPDNLYVASEPWMVYAFLVRSDVKRENIKIIDLEPGELYEIDVFGGKAAIKTTTIELAKEVQRVPFTVTNGATTMHGRTANQRVGAAGVIHVGTSTHGQNQTTISAAVASCSDCDDDPALFGGGGQRENVVQLFPDFAKKFPIGSEVIVKFTRAVPTGATTVRAHQMFGTVIHPGLPALDCQATLLGVYPHELEDWFNEPVIAKVKHVSEHTAGPVVHLRTPEKDIRVQTFDMVVGITEWEYIADKCRCSKCSTPLIFAESKDIFVKRLAMGVEPRYHIECPECLEKTTSGEMNAQQQSGTSTVSNGKSVRVRVEPSAVLRLPSPPGKAST